MTSQSDAKFVESVRRLFRFRRRYGVFLLIFGVLLVASSLCAFSYFQASVLEVTNAISRLASTKQALLESADNLAFVLGFKLGAAIAGMSIGGATLCVYGLYFLFSARKERLLLQYHDEVERVKHEKRA